MAENIDAERDQYKFPMHLRYTMERASLVLKNSADIRRRELDEDQQSLIREVLDDLERACAESGLVARRTPSASIGEDGLPELPPQHDELSARWECDACDGRGHDGEVHWQGHFQPPEPFPCSDCGGIGSHATDAYTADQMRQYARDAVAANRRARGMVPSQMKEPSAREASPQAAQGVKKLPEDLLDELSDAVIEAFNQAFAIKDWAARDHWRDVLTRFEDWRAAPPLSSEQQADTEGGACD